MGTLTALKKKVFEAEPYGPAVNVEKNWACRPCQEKNGHSLLNLKKNTKGVLADGKERADKQIYKIQVHYGNAIRITTV